MKEQESIEWRERSAGLVLFMGVVCLLMACVVTWLGLGTAYSNGFKKGVVNTQADAVKQGVAKWEIDSEGKIVFEYLKSEGR